MRKHKHKWIVCDGASGDPHFIGEAYDLRKVFEDRKSAERAAFKNQILSGADLPIGCGFMGSDNDLYRTWLLHDVLFSLKGDTKMSGKVNKENVVTDLPKKEHDARIRQHAQLREEFYGKEVEGHWRRHWNCDTDWFQMYGVYDTYVTFPLFIWDEDAVNEDGSKGMWFENQDNLSERTDKLRELCRPVKLRDTGARDDLENPIYEVDYDADGKVTFMETVKLGTKDMLLVANGGILELLTVRAEEGEGE